MAYENISYEAAYLFIKNYIKEIDGNDLSDAFCKSYENNEREIDGYKIIVSELFKIEGVMIIKQNSESKSFRACISAYNERALRDLLMYIPNDVEVELYFTHEWMKSTVNEFIYGCDMDSKGYIKGYKRTYQSISYFKDYSEFPNYYANKYGVSITSKKDPVLYEFKELNVLKKRIELSKFVVEGKLLTERALKDGQLVDKILCTPEFLKEDGSEKILELAKEKKVSFFIISTGLMGGVTDTRPLPGIIASINIAIRNHTEAYIAEKESILILDGVANPDNLGMILRTADAGGINSVVLLSNATHYLNKNVIRGARGAVGKLPIYVSNDDDVFFEFLIKQNVQIIALSARAENERLYTMEFKDRTAFIIGNESVGIRKNIYNYCNDSIRIPMVPGQSSLNVAVSAGVVMYEYVRRQVNK